MNTALTVSELGRRVRIEAHEAVAIALQTVEVCVCRTSRAAPFGPPTVDSVFLDPGGQISCPGCAATPAVSEIAALLDAMLPRATGTRVPGGLRYAIARALLEVDARPFDSLAEFTTVLERYERGDRDEVLRTLATRAEDPIDAPAVLPPPIAPTLTAPSLSAPSLSAPSLSTSPLPTAPAPIVVARPPRRFGLGAPALAMVAVAVGSFLLGQRWTPPTSTSEKSASAAAAGDEFAPVSMAGSKAGAVSEPPARAATAAPPIATAKPRAAAPKPSIARVAKQQPGPPSIVRALGGDAGQELSPSFASNGTAMFFHTGLRSGEQSALKSANPLADDLRVMTIVDDGSKNYHVQPSPDGKRIAFDSDRQGERAIYIANIDGSKLERVSPAGYAAVPTWSPDSTRLAFVRAEADRPHVWNLWVQTLNTGALRRLTSFRYGQTWGASWFPDGRRVCFTHEDRIIVLDLESGATREYATPIAGHLVRTPAVSPDGSRVIFQVHRSGAWLLDLRDGSMLCVLTDPTAEEFAWTPDGRRVAFHSRRDGQWGIWIMATDSSGA